MHIVPSRLLAIVNGQAQPSDAASAAGSESARVNPANPKKKNPPPPPQTLEDIFHDVDTMTVVQPVLWLLGTYLRFKAILNDEYREPIAARVEVATPTTDFARIREGAFLWMHGGPRAKVVLAAIAAPTRCT